MLILKLPHFSLTAVREKPSEKARQFQNKHSSVESFLYYLSSNERYPRLQTQNLPLGVLEISPRLKYALSIVNPFESKPAK